MNKEIWMCRDDDGSGDYAFCMLQKPKPKIGRWGTWALAHGSTVHLCGRYSHRVFPLIRLKSGAGPIRVMMLGLPLDGLSKEQVATVREEADALEALVVGMRSEA